MMADGVGELGACRRGAALQGLKTNDITTSKTVNVLEQYY